MDGNSHYHYLIIISIKYSKGIRSVRNGGRDAYLWDRQNGW